MISNFDDLSGSDAVEPWTLVRQKLGRALEKFARAHRDLVALADAVQESILLSAAECRDEPKLRGLLATQRELHVAEQALVARIRLIRATLRDLPPASG